MINTLRCRGFLRICIEGLLFLFLFKTATENLSKHISSIYKESNTEDKNNHATNSSYVFNSIGIRNHASASVYNSLHFYVGANKRSIFEKWKMLNKKEKLEYKITYEIGLNIDAQIGDFGDYNSDVKTDLILYKYDETKLVSTIYIYIFDVKESKFKYHCEATLNGIVKNIMAVDWNFDGLLDILVLFTDINGNNESNYYLSAFVQTENTTLIELWNSQKKEKAKERIAGNETAPNFYYTNIHPLIFDINNDGFPDLICQQNDYNKFVRFVWINDKKNGFRSIPWESITNLEYEMKYKDEKEAKQIGEISNPHSSAIVDLNGDCKSDIVFTVYNERRNISLEIWLNTMNAGKGVYRKLDINFDLPPNSLQILFGDFNADGSIDMIVPTCQKSRSCNNCCVGNDQIYFIPNIQKKICNKTWTQVDQSQCRPVHNLCSESDFHFLSPPNDNYISIIDENNNLHFAGDDQNPQYISVGDIDNDGYLDLLITLRTNDENKYVRIYKSELKTYDEEVNIDVPTFFNFYQFIMSSNESENRNIYNSAFFDVYENGMLDILIFGKYVNNKTNEIKYTAVSFIRKGDADSLFLKATSLNGICMNNCYKHKPRSDNVNVNISTIDNDSASENEDETTVITSTTLNDTINTTNNTTATSTDTSTGTSTSTSSTASAEKRMPLGTNIQGPAFKITVIDINGIKTCRIGIQRSQSSHSPLQLPYVIFGLGRTSNYVEEFYLGMPTQEAKYYNMWVSIIPNSHIIVIPYPLDNSNEWKIQLSVNPSNKIYSIIYITLICLAIIGLLIFILDRKEKIEDLKEERGFKSHFVIG